MIVCFFVCHDLSSLEVEECQINYDLSFVGKLMHKFPNIKKILLSPDGDVNYYDVTGYFQYRTWDNKHTVTICGSQNSHAFESFFEHVHNLDEIYLIKCHMLSQHTFDNVAKHNPLLTLFSMKNCTNVTCDFLVPIFTQCSGITTLSLKNTNNVNSEQLATLLSAQNNIKNQITITIITTI